MSNLHRFAPGPPVGNDTFGWRLYSAMITRVWTQTDLAERAQLPKGRIRELINDRERPTAPELERLAAALSVEVHTLLPGSDDLPSEQAVPRVPEDRFVSVGAVSGLYKLALERMEELAGCTEGSAEKAELTRLAEIVATYEQAVGVPEPARRSAVLHRPAVNIVSVAIHGSVQNLQGSPELG
jgi:transcriptional regulator with XRE-family HTH domain